VSSRYWAGLGCVAVAGLFALVPLGRWERGDADRKEVAALERTRALVGDVLASPRLAAYRLTTKADCLLYRFGGDPYAVELCFDGRGRLVTAIDRRRRDHTRIASVAYRPSLDPRPAIPQSLFALFQRLGAIPPDARFAGTLPLAGALRLPREVAPGDSGPILVGDTAS
jgi:hypothetical protein